VIRETTSRDLCGLVCPSRTLCVCFITAGPIAKAVRVGGGGEWRTCATRDDEPRPVWTSLPITHTLLSTIHFFFSRVASFSRFAQARASAKIRPGAPTSGEETKPCCDR
jgi:hypothetical protein